MALLTILEFPDPRLRTKAAEVDPADLATPAFQTLIDAMFESMYAAPASAWPPARWTCTSASW